VRAAFRQVPSPSPSSTYSSFSGALFGNVQAHVNAWHSAYPIDLDALRRSDLPPRLAYSKKGWQNNGVSTYPHSSSGDETYTEAVPKDNFLR
jgi:hypothetical protein